MSVTRNIKYTRAFKMTKQVFAAEFCLMVSGFAVKFTLTIEVSCFFSPFYALFRVYIWKVWLKVVLKLVSKVLRVDLLDWKYWPLGHRGGGGWMDASLGWLIGQQHGQWKCRSGMKGFCHGPGDETEANMAETSWKLPRGHITAASSPRHKIWAAQNLQVCSNYSCWISLYVETAVA